jgi:threonine synthase
VKLSGFLEPSESYPIDEIRYTTSSGGLLEVEHDMSALAQVDGDTWRRLFDKRMGGPFYPYGSGVWSKKEWVLPHIPAEEVISLGEGNSHLMRASQFEKAVDMSHIWIKQCGVSHSGSFKDLGMTALLSQVNYLMNRGKHLKAVGCASSGDTSAAVSAYASASGIPSVVFFPAGKVSPSQLIQPISNGSLVLCLDTDFDGCMECIKQVVQEYPVYLANSMNPLRLEGQKTVSIDIAQQLFWDLPDTVIIPGGNLGNTYALYKGFKMCKDLGLTDRIPRIIVSQTEMANPLYLAYQKGLDKDSSFEPVKAGETYASAIRIGNPVSYERARRAIIETGGSVEQCTEEELMDACAIGDRAGMFNCPHTGTSLAVLMKLRSEGKIQKDEKTVIVSTAHGLKFTESKAQYHMKELDITCRYANQLQTLPPKPDMIIDALKQRFDN